jgi:aminoglycoside phosphotransferase family enzyme
MNPAISSSSSTFGLLVKTSPLYRTSLIPANAISTRHCYDIESLQKTSSAYLLFAKQKESQERFAIKILRRYKDTRYSMGTANERQQYQLEALHCNSMFAPGVYIGLARIHDWNFYQNILILGEIIANPTKEKLDPKAEYALVMHSLPQERRLDFLLKNDNIISLQRHIRLLAEYVVYMHEKLIGPPITSEGTMLWGSFEQLQKKLQDNLALLDLVVTTSENGRSSSFHLRRNTLSQLLSQSYRRSIEHSNKRSHDDLNLSSQLRDILDRLKRNLLLVLRQYPYKEYFNQRVQEQRIKRCHGDLKAPHIWIAPYSSCFIAPYSNCFRGEPWKYVCVLDTIDFNLMFCNIDVLSDLAMLLIDLQARTKSFELAKSMEDYYLMSTGQQDKVSRSVLNYYLVEKAIMWAAVSIIYDNLPELGLVYLEIAEQRMNNLMEGDLMWRGDTLIGIPPVSLLLSTHAR